MAVSDELGLFAHPRPALQVSGKDLVTSIARLAESEDASELIVGLPLALSGADSPQTRLVRDMVASLRARLSIPVIVWDERLSSVEAGRHVGRGASRRTGEVDSMAAALILQAVLDRRKGGGAP